MPHRYRIHFLCDECSERHPTLIVVGRNDLLAADLRVGDIYDGMEVPARIATRLGNSFRCPNIGKISQRDLVLVDDAPPLPPEPLRAISFTDDLI